MDFDVLDAPSVAARDRRRSPRFYAQDQVNGELIPGTGPILVLDLSHDGGLFETVEALPVGSTRQVRLFTLDGSISVLVLAEVVHSRRDSASARYSMFISGCRFIGSQGEDTERALTRLIDLLANA